MLTKIIWDISRYQDAFYRMLGYPEDGPLKVLGTVLLAFSVCIPLLAICTVIWLLYRQLMIRLGKDALTGYRRYQKAFAGGRARSSDRIADNISAPPAGLAGRDKLARRRGMILLVIFWLLAYAIYLSVMIPDILELIVTVSRQLGEHRYAGPAFFRVVFQEVLEIIALAAIPAAALYIVIVLICIMDSLYKRTGLLFKTRTRITTKVVNMKKVHDEKPDI